MILVSIKGGALPMPQQKLTIVPVTLHAENKKSLPSTSSKEPSTSICTIKTANVEISFYGGVDFYEYTKKLLTDLPNLGIHQNPGILDQYMPWSKMIQAACSRK